MSKSDTLERTKTEIKLPSQYNVILLNDNITTQEFVIEVLIEIFNHKDKDAYNIMMKVHTEGSGIAGTYEKQIAEMKVGEVKLANKTFNCNLQVRMEEV